MEIKDKSYWGRKVFGADEMAEVGTEMIFQISEINVRGMVNTGNEYQL